MHRIRTTAAPPPKRWDRRPRARAVLSDLAMYAVWFVIVAAFILAGCLLLTLAWPS